MGILSIFQKEKPGDIIESAGNAVEKIGNLIHGKDKDIALAMIDLWKQETQHSSVFVAGWRPFIGWVLGFCIALFALFVNIAFAISFFKNGMKLEIDPMTLITLVSEMLGMGLFGYLRTKEKTDGVQDKH
jgi:hypothetical protein